MGYTHYWRRVEHLNKQAFAAAVDEIRQIADHVKTLGVKVCGPTGSGKPEFSEFTIAFNGCAKCGHRYRNIGKPWPAEDAEGVMGVDDPVDHEQPPAFAGPFLKTRACGGSCAQEEFVVDRDWLHADWHQTESGMYPQQCETRYKPFDLLVTASLLRLKENLGEEIVVSSDGDEKAFQDAKRICRQLFGWPSHFELEPRSPVLTTAE